MLLEAGVPAEVIGSLEGATDPGQVLQELVSSGVLPDPTDALAGLIGSWEPLLARGVDPLKAELCGYEFLAVLRAGQPEPDEFAAMLGDLVGHAEGYGGDAALAMLRVLAVVGPDDVRPAAGQAADRLAGAGLKDRPWVTGLGVPQVIACFGYGDDDGAQESIAVTFRYGRRDHALAVLIDHELGGGVKDCWPAAEPQVIRAEYRRVARQVGLRYREYTPAEARAILQSALDRPTCAEQPDQIDDVGMYLELLRRRLPLLLPGGSADTQPVTGRGLGTTGRPAPASTVHRMKITLRGSKPPIWRRLEVPSEITLQELHAVIQAAFGWQDHHMWVFESGSGAYGLPDPELGHRSAASKKLSGVAPGPGARLRYTYDFGDDWEHDVAVEDVLAPEPGMSYPRCVTGRRATPPEDCGGMWGYAGMLDVLADPTHSEHADMLRWLGLDSPAEFDPARFDLDAINRALSGLRIGRAGR